MQIQCPFCEAQARIPEGQEGAKVRCGECQKVYTARPPRGPGGRRSSSNTTGLTIGIFVGAGVLIAVVFFFINKTKPAGVRPMIEAEAREPEVQVDSSGWNSEPVAAVRELYAAAEVLDAARLRGLLHLERLRGATEGAAVDAEDLVNDTIAALIEGEDEDLVAKWKPFDGTVIAENDLEATVRIKVQGRGAETALETRTMKFELARDAAAGGRWKIWAFERYLSPDELAAIARRKAKPYEKVTLSDGAVVWEAEPRPLEHLDDTPEELRRQIDDAFARLIDFELRPPENAAAKRELAEIGRAALPILLTGLYEIPLETDEQAMKVNLINQCLEEITGNYTGWMPSVSEGGALGTTRERRDSAIKQWFAWWYRRGHRFEKKEQQKDLLEDLIVPTERDLRQMERDKASSGG